MADKSDTVKPTAEELHKAKLEHPQRAIRRERPPVKATPTEVELDQEPQADEVAAPPAGSTLAPVREPIIGAKES